MEVVRKGDGEDRRRSRSENDGRGRRERERESECAEKDRQGNGRESKHVRGRRSSERCTEEVVLKLEGAAGRRRTC